MLHMILGTAGTGKSALLIDKISALTGQGIPVRTLVPEPFAFTYDKRLYRTLGARGFDRVTTGSFRSLTAEILDAVGEDPRDAADDVIKMTVLHRILAALSKGRVLGFYGAQTDRPDFLPAMTAQLTELMQSGTTPAALLDAAAAAEGALAEKLMDIARIYADYLAELERRGLRDALCDQSAAAACADASGYLAGARIFLDEFESFTGDQYAMLEVMLRDAAEVWIALHTDDADAPDYTRFDAVSQTARRLARLAREQNIPVDSQLLTVPYRYADGSLEHLSRYLFVPSAPAYAEKTAVTVAEARDMTLEAEYVAAQIRQLLMEGTYRAGDIMVVMHSIAGYGSLLEAAFQRYEIPYFMDQRRSVLHTAVMKLPLALTALMQRTTTEQMLLLLKTQLSPLHPAEAAELENYAYTWDIDGEQWERPFAAETDPGGICEGIREKLMPHILKMRKAAQRKDVTGAELCGALYRCMDGMGVPKRVGGLAAHMTEQEDVQGARAIRRLWNRFTELLDALHEALEDTVLSPGQLGELLTAILRTDQIPAVPQTLDAVTVMSAAAARYDAPKVVFVLGVNAGSFPADIAEGGFFTERERTLLAAQGVELSRSVRDLCADERLIVYKTLSAASERLWLCCPLADERGRHLMPSDLLEEVRRLLPKLDRVRADEMGAAFYVSTKAAAYYSFVQDYRVREGERAAVRAVLSQMPAEAERLARMQRTSDPARLRVTDPALMQQLTGQTMQVSATLIDDLMQCPFKAFCKSGLRLYLRQKQNLNPLSGGNLVHYCMERLFRLHPERADFLAMTADDLRAHAEQCAAEFLTQELGGSQGRSARFMQQYGRMTKRMLALLMHTQKEMRQSQFTPDASELVIGRVGEETGTAPFRITLENGMQLCLNGKIDRVDVTEQDGQTYLRVVDYKTGQKQFSLADIYYGLNLQMLLYLFALEDDPARYADAKPAGVLYMPSGTPPPQRREEMEPLADYLARYFRMSGTVLCDRGILSKMEAQIAGVYIPVQRAAEDTGSGELKLTKDSQVFTPEQLGRLRRYVTKLVADSAALYASGEVAPKPMRRRNSSDRYYADACAHCDYRGICGVTGEDTACFRLPQTEAESAAAMQEILSSEEQ